MSIFGMEQIQKLEKTLESYPSINSVLVSLEKKTKIQKLYLIYGNIFYHFIVGIIVHMGCWVGNNVYVNHSWSLKPLITSIDSPKGWTNLMVEILMNAPARAFNHLQHFGRMRVKFSWNKIGCSCPKPDCSYTTLQLPAQKSVFPISNF